MGASTTTTLTELVPQIESEAQLWIADRSMFYPGKGDTFNLLRFADLRGQPGDSYRFNQFAKITAGDATEGDDYATTSALDSGGGTTITVTEKVVIIPITDLSKSAYQFGGQQLVAEAGEAIGLAMAEKIDKDVFALFASLGTTINGTGTDLTIAEFQQYIKTLRTNKAPMPYAAFFHPHGWYKFVTEGSSPVPDSAKSDIVGKAIWSQYFAGNVMGVDCFIHADMPDENAAADHGGAFISNRALGMVLKSDLRIEEQRDASARLTELVGVMTYGVGVLDTTMGYEMVQDHV